MSTQPDSPPTHKNKPEASPLPTWDTNLDFLSSLQNAGTWIPCNRSCMESWWEPVGFLWFWRYCNCVEERKNKAEEVNIDNLCEL